MLNLTDKKPNISNKTNLKFSDIEIFYKGAAFQKIGLEYERLSLDKNTFQTNRAFA